MTDASRACPHENCFAPDMRCVFGRDNCELFGAAADGDDGIDGSPGERTAALPWSGLALGVADLAAVAALGGARVVGLVGLSDAGKTTALAAAQLARRRPANGGVGQFAGSYTLMGWHRITRHLQWAPWGEGFPPHTELRDTRTPALLHMALAVQLGSLRHVLYTDVPGEWYARWAFDADAVDGVRWIVEHADAFVLFADSEALAGSSRGEARLRYDALARRLHDVAGERRVVPVRSKADIELSGDMTRFVDELNEELFCASTLPISALEDHGRSITAAIDVATQFAVDRVREPRLTQMASGPDVLFAYRHTAVSA